MIGFNCPNCKHQNFIDGKAENVKGRIYKCDNCGEKILMNNLIQQG